MLQYNVTTFAERGFKLFASSELTLSVLLSEEGLLSLQLPLSVSLLSLDLPPQTLHVLLLLRHALPGRRLLAGGERGTGLPLEILAYNTGRQTEQKV